MTMQEKLQQLRRPFHPDAITFKPQGKSNAPTMAGLAYADLRVYMERLDEVFGSGWEVSYEPWGLDRIIATVTVTISEPYESVSRSSTGETTSESENQDIGGTVAEAQAFKRACAMLGLGRYLYELPRTYAEWDTQRRCFTPAGLAKLRKPVVEHYERLTGEKIGNAPAPAQEDDSLWATDAPGVAPMDEQFYSDGFTLAEAHAPAKPAGLIIPEGKPAEIYAWISHHNGEPWASDVQRELAIRKLGEALGADPRSKEKCAMLGAPGLALLVGRNLGKSIASHLIDGLAQTKWNKETRTAEPNEKYSQVLVDAVRAIAQANGMSID